MRNMLLIAALVVMPLAGAHAANLPSSAGDWHVCASNEDCVVVPGICGEAAVNHTYKNEAAAYYKTEAKGRKCPNLFWKPKTGKARCRLEACEIAN